MGDLLAANRDEILKIESFYPIFSEIQKILKLQYDADKPIDARLNSPEKKDIREKLIKKQEDYAKEAEIKSVELKQSIKKECGQESVVWLAMILKQSKEPSTSLPDLSWPEHLKATAAVYQQYSDKIFDGQVYRELLPYMQLAFAYEQNGSPHEHAFKLVVLFKNSSLALNYLYRHLQQKKSVHDACLFILPDPIRCSFQIWLALANKHIEDPSFRKLLGQACEIEELIVADCKKTQFSAVSTEKIRALRLSIEKNYKEWRTLKRNAAVRAANATRYNFLGAQLLKDGNELTHLRAGLPLTADIDVLTLRCYQQRFICESSKTYGYLLSNGLTKKDYEKFIKLDRTQAGRNIPAITVHGEDVGHAKCYLKKLNVLNEEEAAIAACLGKLTNCCQSLSAELGEASTIHGLTSPNGGFYVLFEGNSKKPKLSDRVIAQCWAWRSKNNVIVFDSIEVDSRSSSTTQMAVDLYRALAKMLCFNGETSRVVCGAYSGISSKVGDLRTVIPEESLDFNGYNDSSSQLIVFDREKPWLLMHRDEDAKKLTETIINTVLESNRPLESTAFCTLLNWSILNKQKNTQARKILESINSRLTQAPNQGGKIKLLQQSLEHYAAENSDLDKIWQEIENNSLFIDSVDSLGRTMLMQVALRNQPVRITKLIKMGANRNAKDSDGMTALHHAAKHPKAIAAILDLIPKEDRLAAINTRESSMGRTVLEMVVYDQPESIATILNSLSEKNRLFAITITDRMGKIPLFRAIENKFSKSLNTMLCSLPENELFAAITFEDQYGDTILRKVIDHVESLVAILTLLPQEKRLSAVILENRLGYTLLNSASGRSQAFIAMISLLSKEDLPAIVQHQYPNGENMLLAWINSNIHTNFESIQRLLSFFPEEERLSVVQMEGKVLNRTRTLIMEIVPFPDYFEAIFNLLPEKDKLTAIKTKDKNGKSLIMNAVSKYESLKLILASCTKEESLSLVKETDSNGKTPLCTAVDFLPKFGRRTFREVIQTIPLILGVYPVEKRPSIVQAKDENGRTILEKIMAYYPFFNVDVLTLLPDTDSLTIYFLALSAIQPFIQDTQQKFSFFEQDNPRCLLFELNKCVTGEMLKEKLISYLSTDIISTSEIQKSILKILSPSSDESEDYKHRLTALIQQWQTIQPSNLKQS